jgi:hypothetical protein
MAAVEVRAALQAVQVKRLHLTVVVLVVVAHCLVVEAEGQQVVVRAVVALEVQSVLFTPVIHASSLQLM